MLAPATAKWRAVASKAVSPADSLAAPPAASSSGAASAAAGEPLPPGVMRFMESRRKN